jgi:hypothetical protein
MGGLFSSPKVKTPAAPKPVRMPVETDPEILAAADRARQARMRSGGRQQTILSDTLMERTGSSGSKLGA